MTKAEAIKRLKYIDIRGALQEDYDAVYMAIEALKKTNEKTAIWIYDKSIDGHYCSRCKTSCYTVMTPYCANCGAKMKAKSKMKCGDD